MAKAASEGREDLVERIYAAALEPHLWSELLLRIAHAVSSPGAVLQVQATATGEVLFAAAGGIEEAILRDYTEHWAAGDPRLAVGFPRRVGQTLSAEEHIDARTFRRSAIYNEFLGPLGLGATLGAIVHADREIFVAAAAQRSLRPEGFSPEEKRRFAAYVPHLARAAKIGHELGAAAAARRELAAALDRLARGVLLLDARMGVRFANRYVEEVLAEADGLHLERGALVAAHPADSASLRALVAGAGARAETGAARAGGYLAVRRRSLRRPLALLVSPVPPELSALVAGRAAAMVFVVDPERRLVLPAEALRQLYGLTPAEARLTLALAEGMGIPEAAEQLGITRETAKSTLRTIFAKTGARRQAELVRLVLTGPGA
ncbi:MAG: helix-turn-helix transcriptional regulator [Thermoanaerobaculia bacterium]|nr:helix-turn-helix transcriptional regulator [Thermoanaerobaculia bacterium]